MSTIALSITINFITMENQNLKKFIENYPFYFLPLGEKRTDLDFEFKVYFFNHLRELFYDPTHYKWKIGMFKKFVKDYDLDRKTCIDILQLGIHYNGKSYTKFVQNLRNKKKTSKKKTQKTSLKIKIDSKFTVLDLYYNLKNNNDATNEEIFSFIENISDIGLTPSTIKSYFHHGRFEN